MDIRVTNTSSWLWTGDAIAIGFFAESLELEGDLAQLDAKLAGTIAELIAETEFKGKSGSTAVARVGGDAPIRKVILVGLGKANEGNVNSYRTAGAAIARLAKRQKCKTLAIHLPLADQSPTAVTQAITEGILLALHQDLRFKSESEDKPAVLTSVDLLGLAGQEAAIELAQKIISGVTFAKELVAAPANVVTPVTMAEAIQKLAAEYGLALEILEREDCEKLGMGAFLGVSQASAIPPKFVHLTYKPEGTPRRKLAIIGKGVTFDSGGLNIKGAGSGIETMKTDMGGAGATFGAAKAIAQIKPDVEVHFISALCENMISSTAMHPGDILTASNGKTIEVNNTDAEGRLTLADALVFTEKLGVEAMIDLATLTGACVVALGNSIGGMWSSTDELAAEISAASTASGEKFWRMPLEEKYFESMKSDIADMKNAGSRGGGAITGAMFLKQFVKETPWAHLDIAGPVWADKENGWNNSGATGYPVRTLVQWILG